MFKILTILFKVVLMIPYVKSHPKVLKIDKYLEEKIGLDLIKQEKMFCLRFLSRFPKILLFLW